MTPATSSRKRKAKRVRIAFARAIETSVEGQAPEAARLWRAGVNRTDKGDLDFTPRSAKLVMQAYAERGNPLAFYYEHEDRLPLAERGGSPMRGVCSAPSSNLAIRAGENGPECWAEHIAWTDEAKRQIVTGERRQISPIAAFDSDTREIIEILNVSLCAEGATHHGTILASRSGRDSDMDELMQKLQEAIEAGDWEAAESLIQEMEAADGGESMAKMAKACVKAAKAAPPPPAAKDEAPPVATKRLAASRDALPAGVNVEAFNRVMADAEKAAAEARAAAKRSDRSTVLVMLSRARDEGLAIDAIDEREHLSAAIPEGTERYLASLRRKKAAGLLIASKPAETAAKPPAEKGGEKTAEEIAVAELTLPERMQIEQFNKGQKNPALHITAVEFQASKRNQQMRPEPAKRDGKVA